jgi:glycosyltransferase involved in cell wall biosynthesis
MRIAIDISPLQSGHKVRGVGFYLTYLKKALLEYYPENEYIFFQKEEAISGSVDVVHYPYFDPFFFTLPFLKKHKTVVTVHDLTPLVFPKHFPAGLKGNIKWQLQRFNLQKVDGILTDSIASKKDIQRIVGINPDYITVAYLAAGEEFKRLKIGDLSLKNIKEKYNLPDEFVLYVGDATWNKNLPRLLHAVKELDVPLVMVGKALVASNIDSNNKWNNDLVAVQKKAAENKKVKLLGFVPTEDLVVLYNLASVLAYPSVYEGFGLPVIEAMQSGCPVIISHEGSVPEVGGNAAEYFDGNSTESLIETIQKVFQSKTLQKELSEKGLDRAKKFSWKKTAEHTVEAYTKVLTGKY